MIKAKIDKNELEIEVDFDTENFIDELVEQMLILNKSIVNRAVLKYLPHSETDVQINIVKLLNRFVGAVLIDEEDTDKDFFEKCYKNNNFEA